MTITEIFQTVKTHLLAQGSRSTGPEGVGCMYRGTDDRMCAVGCLIKDEYYTPLIEGFTADDGKVAAVLKSSGVDISNLLTMDLLCQLQSIHDHRLPSSWGQALAALEEQYAFT